MAPEPSLVGRPVQVDQGVVDRSLIERVEPADGVGDLAVDVRHRPQHALAAETVSSVAQLDRLADAGRRSGGDDGAATGARVEQHLRLDGRVAAGVEDLAPDHVLNGAHDVTPRVPALVGHRATRLAVASLVIGDAFRRDDLVTQRRCTVTQRLFRVDTESLRERRHGEEALPHLPAQFVRVGGEGVVGTRVGALRPTGQRPSAATVAATSGPCGSTSTPTERALRASLFASMSAGSPVGMPSVTLRLPFSSFLIASQLATTWSAAVTSTSPNTWGWRWTSLSCTPRATSARSK